MEGLLNHLLSALYYILPAYVANMTPVVFGGGRPIDLGKNFIDGKRILGDHKTIRGFISGALAGTLIGVMQGRPLCGFLLSLGTMLGDMMGSFFKRRMDIRPGESAPLLDQEGFVMVALALCMPIEPLTLVEILIIVLITPPLHLLANLLAYLLGFKGVKH